MRTTVTFDDDVAAAIERERRERHVGVSAAVNSLIRRGLVARTPREPIELLTYRGGLQIDISNVEEALEIAEGPDHR